MTQMRPQIPRAPLFAGRVLFVALVGVALLVLWRLRDVILLSFVAALIGVGLRGLSDQVRRWTRLPNALCLGIVVVGVAVSVAAVFWIFGAQITAQYDDLVVRLPIAARKLFTWVGANTWGRYALGRVQGASVGAATAPVVHLLAASFGSLAKGFTYTLLAVASGVFLAIEPQRYLSGLLELAPDETRPQIEAFLSRTGLDLKRWLVSRLVVMLAVGVLSSLGLWALGIDAPFALGITGGLLTFIPLIGALMAAVPAIVMAFAKAPIDAVWAALIFWAVHFIEGTFITPYAQDRAIDMPPVVTILSVLAFTLLFGGWGVLFAAPMTLVLILAIRTFYIEGVLGRWAAAPASPQPGPEPQSVEPEPRYGPPSA